MESQKKVKKSLAMRGRFVITILATSSEEAIFQRSVERRDN